MTDTARLSNTDELIAWHDQNSSLTRVELEAAIPAAIDAAYSERDANGTMHSAGAAAAVAALKAAREARRANQEPMHRYGDGETLASARCSIEHRMDIHLPPRRTIAGSAHLDVRVGDRRFAVPYVDLVVRDQHGEQLIISVRVDELEGLVENAKAVRNG